MLRAAGSSSLELRPSPIGCCLAEVDSLVETAAGKERMSTRARRSRQAKRIARTLASLHSPLSGYPRKISLPDPGKRGGGEVMDLRRYGPRLSPVCASSSAWALPRDLGFGECRYNSSDVASLVLRPDLLRVSRDLHPVHWAR